MTQRILVTGASGFIGRHALAPLVKAGAEVHAVSRSPLDNAPPHVIAHRTDLLDQVERHQLVREVRPQLILHAAWETAHGQFWTAPANLDWAAASLELAREAAEHALERFVGVGTCFEYAYGNDGDCHEQSTPIAPYTLYATAKDATRRALAAFAETAGLGFAWGRVFLLYGPGETPTRLVPHVARNLLAGRQAPISKGLAVRDFIDARDAGNALAALALSPVNGPVNIASGQGVTVRELALTLGRLAGRTELVEIGALAERQEPERLVADIARLRDEVGFDAIRPLEEGLAEALDHWRGETEAEPE